MYADETVCVTEDGDCSSKTINYGMPYSCETCNGQSCATCQDPNAYPWTDRCLCNDGFWDHGLGVCELITATRPMWTHGIVGGDTTSDPRNYQHGLFECVQAHRRPGPTDKPTYIHECTSCKDDNAVPTKIDSPVGDIEQQYAFFCDCKPTFRRNLFGLE